MPYTFVGPSTYLALKSIHPHHPFPYTNTKKEINPYPALLNLILHYLILSNSTFHLAVSWQIHKIQFGQYVN